MDQLQNIDTLNIEGQEFKNRKNSVVLSSGFPACLECRTEKVLTISREPSSGR